MKRKKKVKSYSNLLELSENIRLYIKVGKPMAKDEIRSSVQGLWVWEHNALINLHRRSRQEGDRRRLRGDKSGAPLAGAGAELASGWIACTLFTQIAESKSQEKRFLLSELGTRDTEEWVSFGSLSNHHGQHFRFGWEVGGKGKGKETHWQETGRKVWKDPGMLSVH